MPLFTLSFDIDRHLNPYIPSSLIHLLPTPLSFFLGRHHKPRQQLPTLLHAFWAFIGGFCGIALIEAVYSAPLLQAQGAPLILASLGASAILTYNAIDSPLSQPRNLIIGHVLSTTLGIGITKLFLLLPPSTFESSRWAAGALAVGLSSFVMSITKTVHPPAGATALIAATTAEVTEIGWFLLPLILLGDALMLASGCVINNLSGRAWPLYWWTAVDVRALREERRDKREGDLEKGKRQAAPGGAEAEAVKVKSVESADKETDVSRLPSPASHASGTEAEAETDTNEDTENTIVIHPDRFALPSWLDLGTEERAVLEDLQERLREGLREGLSPEVRREETRSSHSHWRSLSLSRSRTRRQSFVR